MRKLNREEVNLGPIPETNPDDNKSAVVIEKRENRLEA
jgi:hypothetical protein